MSMWKRAIALGMTMGMLISSMPVSAYADEMIVEDDFYVVAEDDTEAMIEPENDEVDEAAFDDSLIGEEDELEIVDTFASGIDSDETEKEEILQASDATSGTCGQYLTWTLDSSGTLRISGTGDMYDYDEDNENPFVDLDEELNSVIIENGVTSIGDNAFSDCYLTNITIPNSVTSIGRYAFFECEDLNDITIPNSVTSIGDGAFFFCGSLTNITLPNSITQISDSMFSCSGLTSITIPNSVISIGDNAFRTCQDLTTISIPDKVTRIGESAFMYCNGLQSVTIPNSVTSMGDYAFASCNNLQNVFFDGTEAQWNSINFGTDVFIYCTNAAFHFNSSGGGVQNDEERTISLGSYSALFGPCELTINTTQGVTNTNMAVLCAMLSEAAYSDNGSMLLNLYNQMGANGKGEVYNYDVGGFCYGFGYIPMRINGLDYNVIAVTVRGTNGNIEEFAADFSSEASKNSWGYASYNAVYNFEDTIIKKLNSYCDLHNLREKPIKLIVTGHSIGGAAANLLAARFTRFANSGAWWSSLLSKNDIYAYTFGAIDALKVSKPIDSGYENIHNVYNILDTYGPNGNRLITAAGNSVNGKFGHMDLFKRDHRGLFERITSFLPSLIHDGIALSNSAGINHSMSSYLDSVDKYYATETKNYYTRARIKCPVDVDIFENEKQVGKIRNNTVIDGNTSINMEVVDTAKYIVFPAEKSYIIRITATDEGQMDYSVTTLNGVTSTEKTFSAVQLAKDKKMISKVDGSGSAEGVKLFIVDSNNHTIADIHEDGSESKHTHTWDSGKVTKAATTTAAGIKTFTCTDCGETKTEDIAMLTAAPVSVALTELITISKKPTIKKPTASKGKITVNWKHFKNKTKKGKKIWKKIKKVQIQCSTDKNFQNIVKDVKIGKSKTKYAIKGLKKKTTYYVRVRYYDGTGYSKWSKVKKVKTK